MPYFTPSTPSNYKSPLLPQNFEFVSAHTIFPYYYNAATPTPVYLNYYYQTVYDGENQIFYNEYRFASDKINGIKSVYGEDIGVTVNLVVGHIYTVVYRIHAVVLVGSSLDFHTTSATYKFAVAENKNPLKAWTITDVCGRLFDIAEPLRLGEKPRFYLQGKDPVTGAVTAGSLADRYDKIQAPQFSFTKQTLRECLQQIGGVVHGEPRATAVKASDGNWYYEISFDEYGGTERSGIYARKYIKKTASQVIDSYASYLDSHAENLVNQLSKYAGVITEPYASGYQTVRTETMYARISEENMIIRTKYPIYSIEKIECGIIPGNTDIPAPIDITSYVFESTLYNSQLSSYDSQYPYSKAYGLMYTQGEKNITALNFKQEHPIDQSFEKYAIVNILRAATGNNSLDLTGATSDETHYSAGNYPQLAFRVTYTPFYTARIGQGKVNYLDFPYGAGLIFNQQANVIEARYYGENLKGAIARLGNVELSKTYLLSRLAHVPKAGTLYNDDYYISAVAVEFLPTYIKCTIGLSKDFNRLSQYIGISSVKRFSEVSQGQAMERNTLWREFCVIGDPVTPDGAAGLAQVALLNAVYYTFTQTGGGAPISCVQAWGTSYQGEGNITDAFGISLLPVISSAFGNSVSFSWEYEDNYSSGPVSQYAYNGTGDNSTVTGYFQNNYQYTDYYGRLYYYSFFLYEDAKAPASFDEQTSIGNSLPGAELSVVSGETPYVSTAVAGPIVLRKDNREKLQCNFQLDFVTNRKDMIIGSALAAYNPAVRKTDSSLAAKLYLLDAPLNKFTDNMLGAGIDLSELTAYPITLSSASANRSFTITASNFAASGKAWAICFPQEEGETITVEDEQGNVYQQTEIKGGDLLIAQNMDFAAGDAFPTVTFTLKKEVFNKEVWKDLR